MIAPDILYHFQKNPEKFTKVDLKRIMNYMSWEGRNKVVIAFKSMPDLLESKDFLINYIEERVDFKVEATMIRSNVLKLERRVD